MISGIFLDCGILESLGHRPAGKGLGFRVITGLRVRVQRLGLGYRM